MLRPDIPWSDIDWADPWYAPWRAWGAPAAERIAAGEPVSRALMTASASTASSASTSPVTFVPQDALPEGMAYERFIFETRQVPTREGLHDFFNGLCWQAFPQAKSRLNVLQAAEIARDGVGAVRGPVRDAITVFDENGALLQAPPLLWEALLGRQWRRLFVDLRPLWVQARLVVFGHALLEKLVAPRKDMTAHVWRVDAPLGLPDSASGLAGAAADGAYRAGAGGASSLASADAWLAQALTPEALASKPFTPLPVLGVPGWWPANADPAFYDDARVFRPARPSSGPAEKP